MNEAACQERCRRTALRHACDNTWRSEQRCGRIAAGRGGGAGSGAGTQSSWPGHIYIGWQRCCGAVGRSVARERGSLSRAMQAHCFAARV